MKLPPQHIRAENIMHPCHEETVSETGLTYGLSHAGYDIRLDQDVLLWPLQCKLASSMEYFVMPNDVCADVKDKSTWARRFVTVQNTFIEPGWRGYLTLELINHTFRFVRLRKGDPVALIVFDRLEAPTENPYKGKYQDQERGPQEARLDPRARVRAEELA